MVEPIFVSPFFLDYILPFTLTFTLVFAVLEKTGLLGEDKKQIDALIALVIGIILVSSPLSRIVVLLMPFLAVSLAILLVFMLLYGFISNKKKGEDILHERWKQALIGLFAIALVWTLIVISGYGDFIYDYIFNQPGSRQIWVNGFMIVVVAGALIAVLWNPKSD